VREVKRAALAAICGESYCRRRFEPEYGIENGLEQLLHELRRSLFAQLYEHQRADASGSQQSFGFVSVGGGSSGD
jgi:hypothetical protein